MFFLDKNNDSYLTVFVLNGKLYQGGFFRLRRPDLHVLCCPLTGRMDNILGVLSTVWICEIHPPKDSLFHPLYFFVFSHKNTRNSYQSKDTFSIHTDTLSKKHYLKALYKHKKTTYTSSYKANNKPLDSHISWGKNNEMRKQYTVQRSTTVAAVSGGRAMEAVVNPARRNVKKKEEQTRRGVSSAKYLKKRLLFSSKIWIYIRDPKRIWSFLGLYANIK